MNNTIIFVVNKEGADEIQKFWGGNFPMMAMEEAAEFQQAVSKMERCKEWVDKKEDLITEIADVMISISGLMARYGISDSEINEQIAKKMSMEKKSQIEQFAYDCDMTPVELKMEKEV